MKNILIILHIVFIITIPATSADSDKWNGEEIALEIAWQIGNVLDWRQMRSMTDDHQEIGPLRFLIGQNPDPDRIDLTMAIAAIAHPIITNWMDRDCTIFNRKINLRRTWQGTTLGVKLFAVGRGFAIGLEINR